MSATGPEGRTLELALFVAGEPTTGLRAYANLKAICEAHVRDGYVIEVVDLDEEPQRAGDEGIVAVPTLVIRGPETVARIVGDLSDTAAVLAGLELGAA